VKGDRTVLAVFPYVDQFLACLKTLKEKKYVIADAFSPVRLPEMQDIVARGPSRVRAFTLIGGIVGGCSLVGLAVYAHLSFKLIVWGKPVLAWTPWVLVAFEGTILFASLFAFFSWVFKAGLPQPGTNPGYSRDFSGRKFGIVVRAAAEGAQELVKLLEEHGAEEVRFDAA
jgi:hypothetical protein